MVAVSCRFAVPSRVRSWPQTAFLHLPSRRSSRTPPARSGRARLPDCFDLRTTNGSNGTALAAARTSPSPPRTSTPKATCSSPRQRCSSNTTQRAPGSSRSRLSTMRRARSPRRARAPSSSAIRSLAFRLLASQDPRRSNARGDAPCSTMGEATSGLVRRVRGCCACGSTNDSASPRSNARPC